MAYGIEMFIRVQGLLAARTIAPFFHDQQVIIGGYCLRNHLSRRHIERTYRRLGNGLF